MSDKIKCPDCEKFLSETEYHHYHYCKEDKERADRKASEQKKDVLAKRKYTKEELKKLYEASLEDFDESNELRDALLASFDELEAVKQDYEARGIEISALREMQGKLSYEIDRLEVENKQLKLQQGAEAEALRVAFEQLSQLDDEYIDDCAILDILERIDAGEALAFLENQDKQVGFAELRKQRDNLKEENERLERCKTITDKSWRELVEENIVLKKKMKELVNAFEFVGAMMYKTKSEFYDKIRKIIDNPNWPQENGKD